MNIASAKLELIEWIAKSEDERLLEQIFNLFIQQRQNRQQNLLKEVLMQRAVISENNILEGRVYSELEMKKEIAALL